MRMTSNLARPHLDFALLHPGYDIETLLLAGFPEHKWPRIRVNNRVCICSTLRIDPSLPDRIPWIEGFHNRISTPPLPRPLLKLRVFSQLSLSIK